MTGDLIKLAERVEAASGPDRELDIDIHNALRGVTKKYHDRQYVPRNARAVTASVDAAMKLVPERWGNVGTYPWLAKQKQGVWQAGVSAPGNEKRPPVCYAATPALALTAAALRARASTEPRP